MSEVNSKPLVFIGAASEQDSLAAALETGLGARGLVIARRWDHVVKVENSGQTTIEALTSAVRAYDFGAFILAKDDIIVMKGREIGTARANVVFEAGLFIGRLGREHVFLFGPDNFEADSLSDIGGVALKRWNTNDASPNSAISAAATACRDEIVKIWNNEGSRRRIMSSQPLRPSQSTESLLSKTNIDIWMDAARSDALVKANSRRLDIGTVVVHRSFGIGVVAETGPTGDAGRHVTVEFSSGQWSDVLVDRLYIPEFPG